MVDGNHGYIVSCVRDNFNCEVTNTIKEIFIGAGSVDEVVYFVMADFVSSSIGISITYFYTGLYGSLQIKICYKL